MLMEVFKLISKLLIWLYPTVAGTMSPLWCPEHRSPESELP